MTAVIDASAAVRLALAPDDAPALRRIVAEVDVVVAPELYAAQTANAFWKYVRARVVTRSEAARLLETCLAIPDEYASMAGLAAQAFELACRHQATVYDMTYLELARAREGTLVTLDRKLRQLARARHVPVMPAEAEL